MAVYTFVSAEEAQNFLQNYEIGTLKKITPISEGWENSNFHLETETGNFILTLIEKRTKREDLPWIIGWMNFLSSHHFACPKIEITKQGDFFQNLHGRPALISEFLKGQNNFPITEEMCFLFGKAMAEMHETGRGWRQNRPNTLGVKAWKPLLEKSVQKQKSLEKGILTPEIASLPPVLEKALLRILDHWPEDHLLPRGAVHTDLFPDNVFFQQAADGKYLFSGFIDFYFVCTDFLVMDLAVAVNAWCFTEGEKLVFQPSFAHSLLEGYQSVRPLTAMEKEFFGIFCEGMALRFALTRLWDWMNIQKDALVTPKNPCAYAARLLFFQQENRFPLLMN